MDLFSQTAPEPNTVRGTKCRIWSDLPLHLIQSIQYEIWNRFNRSLQVDKESRSDPDCTCIHLIIDSPWLPLPDQVYMCWDMSWIKAQLLSRKCDWLHYVYSSDNGTSILFVGHFTQHKILRLAKGSQTTELSQCFPLVIVTEAIPKIGLTASYTYYEKAKCTQ